ncbi:MAG: 6-phosphofructokinase [Candidatus Peregrinibacteria bacterium]|nr:6-phosphofructokinase [Candidatus Peregrinibacteria bacterium]
MGGEAGNRDRVIGDIISTRLDPDSDRKPYFVLPTNGGIEGAVLSQILDGEVIECLSSTKMSVLNQMGWDRDTVSRGLYDGSLSKFSQSDLLKLLDRGNACLGITGGGDCAGISDCLASFAQSLRKDKVMLGVQNASEGLALPPDLFDNNLILVDALMRADMVGRGSTPFGSSRKNAFDHEAQNVLDNVRDFGAVYGTGGNGGLAMLERISKAFPEKCVVGTFKSIDGDGLLDGRPTQMLGFNTAVRANRHAVYDIAQSAFAHGTVDVVEVFGRNYGRLAFESARHDTLAVADEGRDLKRKIEELGPIMLILIPEKPASMKDIAEEVLARKKRFGSCVIVVAEGFTPTDYSNGSHSKVSDLIADGLKQFAGLTKVNVTTQTRQARGTRPSYYDKTMGLRIGNRMAELVNEGVVGGKAVVYFEGVDAMQNDPEVVDLHGVSQGSTLLSLHPDGELRKGGVFWKD